MITFDKLIKNFEDFEKNGLTKTKKEIYGLFEPIVYQAILLTRMDTGMGRASLGMPFTKEIISSSRILEAIDSDIKVNQPAYHFWDDYYRPAFSNRRNPKQEYLGTVKQLIDGNRISVNIISYDEGVFNQEQGNEQGRPSKFHPRPDPERHILHHLDQTARTISSIKYLDDMSGTGVFLDEVAKDIRERVKKLYSKVEELLFT